MRAPARARACVAAPPIPVSVARVSQSAFKANLIVKFSARAHASLGSLIGPIVIGTLAGCGGAFTSSADLSALTSLPQPVIDAFYASVVVNLSQHSALYLARLGLSAGFRGDVSEAHVQGALAVSFAALAVLRELRLSLSRAP